MEGQAQPQTTRPAPPQGNQPDSGGILSQEHMRPHIPPDQDKAASVERDMSAKTEKGEGLHTTSASFGLVYSDHATDGAGNGPEYFAKKAEERS